MTIVSAKTGLVYQTPKPVLSEEEKLAAERAGMSVTRGQFLIAAAAAGIITEATAEEAASGAWPSGFNTFLSGLTGPQRIVAKATWADGGSVRRNNAILALVAADQGLSETDLDDLFRAAAQVET